MADTILYLLCAIALAQVGNIRASQNLRTCLTEYEAQQICLSSSNENVLVVHRYCNMFYKCSNGKAYPYKCPSILVYDPVQEHCEWPHLVECGHRPIADNDNDYSADTECIDDNDDGQDNGITTTLPPIADNDSSNEAAVESTCNCDPNEALTICATESSNSILVAHENCNQFYMCAGGIPIPLVCPAGLLYEPYTKQCNYADSVDCGERLIPNSDEDNNTSNNNDGDDNDVVGGGNSDPSEAANICAAVDSESVLVAHENCNQFYMCSKGLPVAMYCPLNLLFNPYSNQCDWPENVDCDHRIIPEHDEDSNSNSDCEDVIDDNLANDTENGDTCNCDPEKAPAICAGVDSDGLLVAHDNCNQFYKCDHGKPVVFTCSPHTLYNPYKEECDWSSNVDCGHRVISESDDNGNLESDGNGGVNDNIANGTCNYDPDEAPAICAGVDSDGVLVAHENCNQFYKCNYGKPVAFSCSPNTLYNSYKEQCDWAAKVDCGDRLIPDANNDNNDGNDNDENNNGEDDNVGTDNGGNDNGNICNCDPEEAPVICSDVDSDGVLVAHENCNQFYKCDHGKPVVFTCPSNTLYNSYKQGCHWSNSVDCGHRVIPESEANNDSESESSGSIDDSESDSSDSIGESESDSSGSVDDSESDSIDDNFESDVENGSRCNCDPGEAPAICAKADSNGVLIAHENCNQFYKCNHGMPAVFTCPRHTLYNCYKERCDWIANVDCGDQLIPDINEYDSDGN